MAKFILSIDGNVIREITLVKERTSIGRRPHNDIHIDNLAISGEHAVLINTPSDVFVEDLGSTNGSFVNGQAINKHLLVDGDVISLGKYRLKYFADATTLTRRGDAQDPLRRELAVRVTAAVARGDLGPASATAAADTVEATPLPLAELEVLSGANAGKQLQLTKARSVVGKAGVQAAAIDRRANGYFLMHLAGDCHPLLNGQSLGDHGQALADLDLIEVAGVKMTFRLKA